MGSPAKSSALLLLCPQGDVASSSAVQVRRTMRSPSQRNVKSRPPHKSSSWTCSKSAIAIREALSKRAGGPEDGRAKERNTKTEI